MKKITKTPYYSYRIGTLSKGCRLCVQGMKTVLFVTGLCPRKCVYCPISDQKHQRDVTFANEWQTSDINDIIKEAELCGSKGAGFTGGDPLTKPNRVVTLIKNLKSHFGNDFHIHLYTSFNLVKEETLKKLHAAGLDEIRFHPDIDDNTLWNRIDLVNDFDWDVGIEIPVIPKKKTSILKLMRFFNKKIRFMNLNELEVSDAKANNLSKLGYRTKDNLSYGVKGSEPLAKDLLKQAVKLDLSYNVHYCTAKLKDKVQLTKRIKRRAKNAKQHFDIINNDGTLTRGVIYLPYLYPSFSYNEKIAKLTAKQKTFIRKKLSTAKRHLMSLGVPNELFMIDEQRLRLLTNVGVIQHMSDKIKSMGLKPAIIIEYPTWDALIIELEWF